MRDGVLRFVALVAALTAGCSGVAKMAKADMASFDRDHYECYKESEVAHHRPLINIGSVIDNSNAQKNLYKLCMKARGYQEQ